MLIAPPPKRFHRVRAIWNHWPAHVTTAILTFVLVAMIAYIGSDPSHRFGIMAQVATLTRKACLGMIGGCMGYWIHRFFLNVKTASDGDVHDRWRLAMLIAVGMYTMGSAA